MELRLYTWDELVDGTGHNIDWLGKKMNESGITFGAVSDVVWGKGGANAFRQDPSNGQVIIATGTDEELQPGNTSGGHYDVVDNEDQTGYGSAGANTPTETAQKFDYGTGMDEELQSGNTSGGHYDVMGNKDQTGYGSAPTKTVQKFDYGTGMDQEIPMGEMLGGHYDVMDDESIRKDIEPRVKRQAENKPGMYGYYQKGENFYRRDEDEREVEVSKENIPVDTVFSVFYTDGGVDERGRPITRQVIKRADGTFQDIIWRKPSIAKSIALDGIPYTNLGANILSRDSVIAHDMDGKRILGHDSFEIFRYPNQKEKYLKNIYDSSETIADGMIESANNLREMAAPQNNSIVNVDGASASLLLLMRFWLERYLRSKEEKNKKS